MKNPQKILGLELLRGLCALLVAIYHCLYLGKIATLYTWGLYGVYVFFVISGAVLYANYHATLPGEITIPQFLWRRFARLAPLIWAGMLVPAIAHNVWVPDQYSLNLSLLQGFTGAGSTSYLTGSWSIGIEVVLYALFPTLLALMASTRMAVATFLILLALRVVFVHFIMKDTDFLHVSAIYIQPGAFLCFFAGGMLIAKVMPLIEAKWGLVAVFIAAMLFAFPGSGFDEVLLGWRGFALTMLSMAVVVASFWTTQNNALAAVAQFFGDVSYGLYLLHPLAWFATLKFLPAMSVGAHIAWTLGLSLVGAWLSFKLYETPLRRYLVRHQAISKDNSPRTSTAPAVQLTADGMSTKT